MKDYERDWKQLFNIKLFKTLPGLQNLSSEDKKEVEKEVCNQRKQKTRRKSAR